MTLDFAFLDPLAHHEALLGIYREVLQGDVDSEQFRWKYERNPLGAMTVSAAIASDSGEIAGAFCAYPRIFLHGGKRVLVYQDADAMVRSSYRGMKLFGTLTDRLNDHIRRIGAPFHYGYSNSQSTPILGRRPDTRVFEVSSAYAYVNGAREVVRSYLKLTGTKAAIVERFGTPAVRAMNFVRGHRRSSRLTLEPVTRFDGEVSDWSEENAANHAWFPLRDAAFLDWRALQVPARQRSQTLPFWFARGGKRIGYCLLYEDRARHVLKLLDVLTSKPDENLTECIRAVRAYARRLGIDAITTNMASDAYQQALTAAGFRRAGPRIPTYSIFTDAARAPEHTFGGDYWYQAPIDRDNFAY